MYVYMYVCMYHERNVYSPMYVIDEEIQAWDTECDLECYIMVWGGMMLVLSFFINPFCLIFLIFYSSLELWKFPFEDAMYTYLS